MNEYVEALRSIAIMLDIETDDLLKLEELVERATPKEIEKIDGDEHWLCCPNCNELIYYGILEDHKYCLNCGQALGGW